MLPVSSYQVLDIGDGVLQLLSCQFLSRAPIQLVCSGIPGFTEPSVLAATTLCLLLTGYFLGTSIPKEMPTLDSPVQGS